MAKRVLPSRFRRAEPAAFPRASNTVITCGGVHGAQWMGINRQGAFSAWAPTTNGSMSVGDCQQHGMQPGHPEGRAGAQAAASVEHLGWARSVLRGWPPSQGQRPWPTIDTPPCHSSRHASPRNAICCPTPQHLHPHPTHLHETFPSSCPCSSESILVCIYMYLYVYAYLCAYMHIFAGMYVRIFTCRCL